MVPLEDSFLKLANDAPVMLWVTDPDQNFVFYNNSWLQFRGNSLMEEVQDSRMERVHVKDQERLIKKFQKGFESRKAYKIEYRLKHHDGCFRWILENGIPNYDSNNEFIGFIGSCVDIHEVKELDKRKNDFITAASHELKTPVTSLKVYLHLLDEYFALHHDEKYRAYVTGAIDQVNRINSLIEELLDLNKIQSGTLNYEFQEIDFDNLVREIITHARLLNPSREILLNGSSGAHIHGDKIRLTQAIENLLNNSLKYSEDLTEIIVDISKDNRHVTLNVKDFGIGIAKEFCSKIFDRFFRVPGPVEITYPGLGMGLYLAQKIISKHKGKISVESCENEYTKFSIKIPSYIKN